MGETTNLCWDSTNQVVVFEYHSIYVGSCALYAIPTKLGTFRRTYQKSVQGSELILVHLLVQFGPPVALYKATKAAFWGGSVCPKVVTKKVNNKNETDMALRAFFFFFYPYSSMHSDLAVHRCRAIKGWKIDGILALALNPSDTKLARAREGGYIDILHFPSLSHSMVCSMRFKLIFRPYW